MVFLRLLLAAGLTFAAAAAAAAEAPAAGALAGVRNVILMIGDGMGPQEVNLLMLYARYAPHSIYPDRIAAMERLFNAGVVGVVRTEPHGAMVVDSAAAATQLATGQYAGSEMIGLNYKGERAETIAEVAHRLGKSAGLVTNTRISHATPAGFAAHQINRNMENEIAVDLFDNRVDVLFGGGLRNWVPQAVNDNQSAAYAALMQTTGAAYPATSKRQDNRDLLLEARKVYGLAFDRAGLAKLAKTPALGLFADSELMDALMEKAAREDDASRTEPTPVEMSAKALELLNQDPDGFFLMIEGGQIDWAGHNNDAGVMLHELLRFDEAICTVMDWVSKRDDTLLLVTADHETGGFGFSYAGRPIPAPVTLEGQAARGKQFAPNFNYAPQDLLDTIYNQKKSFFQIFTAFDALPEKEKTAEKLVELVNDASDAKITLDDAVAVLTRARNRSYVEGHPYMSTQTVPQIVDFEAFYVYGENLRMNQLARRLSPQLHVAWSAGTHTSTPVLIGAYGPAAATRRFSGMMHATDVGKRMIELISSGAVSVKPLDVAGGK
jgi:alkaline phosphatase